MNIKAVDHLNYINKYYEDEINKSIVNSQIYSDYNLPYCKKDVATKVILTPQDSLTAAHNYNNGKTAILNFADYYVPGGRYLSGANSQEETLCLESTLYAVLSSEQLKHYYLWNRSHKNNGLYTNRAIYSPDIVFEREGQFKQKFDVITCAMANKEVAQGHCNVTKEENRETMRKRIKFLYSICGINNVDTLIAGAWGCGVFGQNPYEVARLFFEERCNVTNLIFAVPDENSLNYRSFKETMETF